MAKPVTLELCRIHLFDDENKLRDSNISQQAIDRIIRLRAAFNMWQSYPSKKDAEIRDFITRNSGVSKSAAYEDIRILKTLLGDFSETSKEFHRFRFNAMIDKTFDLAEKKQDAKAMGSAAAHYAKFNQLDREDAIKLPWDEIIPQRFEPSSNPESIGIKPIANIKEKIEAMKKKYFNDIAEDIDYEDVDFNEDQYFKDEKTDIL